MRHIKKGAEPKFFRDWKDSGNADWQPSWEDLQKPEKPELHRLLLSFQGSLCCYCAARITEATSHIEHVRPKDQQRFPELELEYGNLLACCEGGASDTPPRQMHCDRMKDNWYDEHHFISPLNPECEAVFRFTGRGEIIPDDNHPRKDAAETTIRVLNLGCAKLTRARREVIDGVLAALTSDDIDEYYRKLCELDARNRAAQVAPEAFEEELPPFLPALLHVLAPASS
jgi:uncharacterized protein (TIGR02646 family)